MPIVVYALVFRHSWSNQLDIHVLLNHACSKVVATLANYSPHTVAIATLAILRIFWYKLLQTLIASLNDE